MSLEKSMRRDLDPAERHAQDEFEISPGTIASLLALHASTLRGMARKLDGDFDAHGFEGAKAQGELRRARKLKP